MQKPDENEHNENDVCKKRGRKPVKIQTTTQPVEEEKTRKETETNTETETKSKPETKLKTETKSKTKQMQPYRPTKNKPKNKSFFINLKDENIFQNIVVVLNCCEKDLQQLPVLPPPFVEEEKKEEDIMSKITKLQYNLYKNKCNETPSYCFWDTCFFDWKPFIIPKSIQGDKIIGYGNFCSPECALAFLEKEEINKSDKQERCTLLNNIYRNSPNDKNIISAISPYYILDKFLGNLTIDEYRKNFNILSSFSFIDKPISRLLPELFENNSTNFVNKDNKKYRLKLATDYSYK